MAGPYDYWNKGDVPAPGLMRSESTENEIARRQLGQTQPVTILQDLLGRMDPSLGAQNAFRDAVRRKLLGIMTQTGGPAADNWGVKSTYGN